LSVATTVVWKVKWNDWDLSFTKIMASKLSLSSEVESRIVLRVKHGSERE